MRIGGFAPVKGIMFKPDMIKAIVEGRKTQTRRVIKPQPSGMDKAYYNDFKRDFGLSKPRYKVGETVYIKEAYIYTPDRKVIYKLDNYPNITDWWNPMFMAAEFSRYFIRITGIRAERVQDITEEDAIAEGCQLIAKTIRPFELKPKPHFTGLERPFTHRDHFIGIWDSINKPPYDYDRNPYVWAYTFERALQGKRQAK